MRYLELCAGAGGTRAGLDAAGWRCEFAVDHDADAATIHARACGQIAIEDVARLSPHDLPDVPVWVAGFPCQPFSSSGHKSGFEHRSGTVFDAIVRLVDARNPAVLLFENVVGLLSNKDGHTFGTILNTLTGRGYEVEWIVLDAAHFSVPQTRPRVFVVAYQESFVNQSSRKLLQENLLELARPSLVFQDLLVRQRLWVDEVRHGSVGLLCRDRQPAIGKARGERSPFGAHGVAHGDTFWSGRVRGSMHAVSPEIMGQIVAPSFKASLAIRSARFWSERGGGGVHGLHLRDLSVAHCVGTSLGGAPLFAIPKQLAKTSSERHAFLEFSDWHREQQDVLVMRLAPARAVLLFGEHTAGLHEAFERWHAGATRKFRLIGNMVVPTVARAVAMCVERFFAQCGVEGARLSTRRAQQSSLKVEPS